MIGHRHNGRWAVKGIWRHCGLPAWLAVGLGLCLTGCMSVAPWERGNLAQPEMAADAHPLQRAFREHVYMSREAAMSAGGEGGGGCGCY
jgi:hypothetical protein